MLQWTGIVNFDIIVIFTVKIEFISKREHFIMMLNNNISVKKPVNPDILWVLLKIM